MLIQIKTMVSLEISKPEDLRRLGILVEETNLKLNKSELARQLQIDRKTVNKHLKGFQKSKHRKKGSSCDEYYSVIQELLTSKTQRFHFRTVLYRYLVDNYSFTIPEQTLYHYLKTVKEFDAYFREGKMSNSSANPVIRFETSPGVQAQLDWKEKISFVLKDGEVIEVNIMVLILGYSRFRIYKCAVNMTQEMLLHLLTEAFEDIGGVPYEILTDNMRTVMDQARTSTFPGTVNSKFAVYAKDFGIKVKPCVAASPKTKGKVESQMKFLEEIKAYSGKLNLVELYDLVDRINSRVNSSISKGTGKIPIIEFDKEKDSLLPLPNESIRNQYRIRTVKVKVNTAGMINIKSNQYSVPRYCIGQTVAYQIHDSHVYVYCNTKLVAVHQLSDQKLNYTPEHYSEVLAVKFPGKDSDEIREFAINNLKLIGGIYTK